MDSNKHNFLFSLEVIQMIYILFVMAGAIFIVIFLGYILDKLGDRYKK
jgi:hypothetical protein